MKQKLSDLLGSFGVILYFIISITVSVMPFVMIGLPFWINLLFFTILQFFPGLSIVFWVWGLIAGIKGVQDLWAIIYYILFAVMFLPFFISVILDSIPFLGKKKSPKQHAIQSDDVSNSAELNKPSKKNTLFTWIITIVSVCVISFCLVQILNYQQTIE